MPVVATHNGAFHADEVSAVAILKRAIPNVSVVRSRKPEIIQEADIVVDVGQLYDPEKNLFDHHQESCAERWNNDDKDSIPLSSVGMVYKKYGREFLRSFVEMTDDQLDKLYESFYYNYVREVDAWDNGVSPMNFDKNSKERPKFRMCTNVSSMVAMMNGQDPGDDVMQGLLFSRAVEYCANVMEIIVKVQASRIVTYEADYKAVTEAYESKKHTGLLVFDKPITNLFKAINDFESERKIVGEIKMVVYPSSGEWRVRNISDSGFAGRAYIPKNIRSMVSQNADIIFVHKNLFLASCKTKECAEEVGRVTLTHDNKPEEPSD